MSKQIREILEMKDEAGETIRRKLHKLLSTLWEEKEGFSGKRPFGDSGWPYEFYEILIKNRAVEGSIDENGYIERLNTKKADQVIAACIDECFKHYEKCDTCFPMQLA